MTRQYGHKWSIQGGVYDGQQLSKNFVVWCEDLQHFGEKQWNRVFKRIEHDIKEAARMGKESWPPSPVAVVEYAADNTDEEGWKMYKAFDRSTAVEDLKKKEERHELGKHQCSNLLDMFK